MTAALVLSITCSVCTNVMAEAVTLHPCGHSVCKQCWVARRAEDEEALLRGCARKNKACAACGRLCICICIDLSVCLSIDRSIYLSIYLDDDR